MVETNTHRIVGEFRFEEKIVSSGYSVVVLGLFTLSADDMRSAVTLATVHWADVRL